MASQQTATTTRVTVSQVIGGGTFDGEIQGIASEQVDPTTVQAVFRSFNETARDDSELSDEQAAKMRFVVTGDLKEEHEFFKSDPASVVAEQVKSIADMVEEELRKDDVITQADDEVIRGCVRQAEGTDETDSGAAKVDLVQVKDHLMKVFGHLLSKEELMKSSPLKILIRFASGIAYCYNFCKKLLLRYLHNFMPDTVVDMICTIASYFMQYLLAVGFDRIMQNLGGWANIVGSLAITKLLGAATERLGTSKYFFGAAAVVSAGIAIYLHFYGK